MSVIALARAYPCRLGAPVLSAVDTRVFTLRYYRDCMGCGFCRDACCRHGVDIDVENTVRLAALPEDFHTAMGLPVTEWFVGAPVADAEFPGGAYLRTATRDGACVFRDLAGRGCRIHAYCLDRGLDYHLFKPMVSVLFPVTFEKGVLAAADEILDGSLVCAGAGSSLYAGARAALGYYFGAALVTELDRLADEWHCAL